MAATATLVALSGASNGLAIKVAATSTPGTTIHTAQAGTAGFDRIWLYAVNSDTTALKLTIEFGGVTAPDNLIEQTIPPESGLFLVIPGLILQNGLVVKAFAATTNLITIVGHVIRETN